MTAYQRKFVKFKFTFCTSVNVQRSKSSRSDCQVRSRKVNGKQVPALMLSESNCVSGRNTRSEVPNLCKHHFFYIFFLLSMFFQAATGN